MKPLIYYGQNQEDIILSAFFPDIEKGFYVDVGACDPIKYSVTKLFYEKGWSGINIEPQEEQYKKLVKDRKRDINLNVGIGDKNSEMHLRVYENESLSTFSREVKEEYKSIKERKSLKYTDKPVEVQTLKAVLESNTVSQIHFLKVDVEGLEYSVLKGNDWTQFRPEVICIEANNMVKSENWRKLLIDVGYKICYFDGLNEYYTEKNSARVELFKETYQKIIVSVPKLSYEWDVRIQEIVSQLERVQETLDNYVSLTDNLKKQLSRTKKYAKTHPRDNWLRIAIKRVLKK